MRRKDMRLHVFDAMSQPVMLIGRGYVVIDANRAACAMMNRPLKQVVGRPCYEMVHGLDAPCAQSRTLTCPVLTAFKLGQRVKTVHRHVHEGKVGFEEIVATPLPDRDGRLDLVLKECRDVTELIHVEEISEHLKTEVKTLWGIIPICASCKRVRTGDGYWQQVETYVRDHTEADFTHGYCPECAERVKKEMHAIRTRRRKPGKP
jgi:hypothetical protein